MEIIERGGVKVPASYIGDGLYAIFDGMGVWLLANDHEYPTDEVYLEPEVLSNLNLFWKEVHEKDFIKYIKDINRR